MLVSAGRENPVHLTQLCLEAGSRVKLWNCVCRIPITLIYLPHSTMYTLKVGLVYFKIFVWKLSGIFLLQTFVIVPGMSDIELSLLSPRPHRKKQTQWEAIGGTLARDWSWPCHHTQTSLMLSVGKVTTLVYFLWIWEIGLNLQGFRSPLT